MLDLDVAMPCKWFKRTRFIVLSGISFYKNLHFNCKNSFTNLIHRLSICKLSFDVEFAVNSRPANVSAWFIVYAGIDEKMNTQFRRSLSNASPSGDGKNHVEIVVRDFGLTVPGLWIYGHYDGVVKAPEECSVTEDCRLQIVYLT